MSSNIPKRTSTLDKYRKVQPKKDDDKNTPANEIRVTKKTRTSGGYLLYAANLLLKENHDTVNIKAAGNAISRAVTVAEILRHKILNLHQVCKISQTEIVDEWEPLEEGLEVVRNVKVLPVLEIKLTRTPTEEDLKNSNYQAPLPVNEVQELDLNRERKPKPQKPKTTNQNNKQGQGQKRGGGQGGQKRGQYSGKRGGGFSGTGNNGNRGQRGTRGNRRGGRGNRRGNNNGGYRQGGNRQQY